MQGLYNVNENTQTATALSTYIPAGIHKNLHMVEVKYDVSKNGKEFLAFYAENDQGDKVSNTEWPFNPKKPWEQMDESEKETALSIIENQKAKVKQIVEIFKPNFNIVASTFKEFAEKTVEFLGDSYKDKKFRLKVVYDRRNYTTFAQNARYIFIEPMTVSDEDSQIRILPSDKMERDATTPDRNSTEKNPLDDEDTTSQTENKSVSGEDKLPF